MSIVRTAGIEGYDRLATALGGRPLAQHQIATYRSGESDLPDRYFRYCDVMDLLEEAADRLHCADFGLRLADQQNIDVLGALGVAMRTAPTLRAAFNVAERYMRFHSPVVRTVLEPLADPRYEFLSFEVMQSDADPLKRTQLYELSVGQTHRVLQQLSDGLCCPKEIWFQHEPRSPLSRYRSTFGITPSFCSNRSGIVIAREYLERKLTSSDAMIAQLAEHYLAATCPVTKSTIAEQVAQVIDMLMREGDCTQGEVAEALGMAPRTLQRRLASERMTFEGIRDNVRMENACDLLRTSALSLTAISERLRYAEPSAFTRSCQRWFGQSPRSYRYAATQRQ